MLTVRNTFKEGNCMAKKESFAAIMIAALMVFAVVLPAANLSAETNLTPDGLFDPNKESASSAEHNSYAWCGMVYTQSDGKDYLWVGTNRDLGGAVITMALGGPAVANTAMRNALCAMVGIPIPVLDNAGKIYRICLSDLDVDNPEWELMWEDDAINGYRKMLIFNDDLYVFAGLSNRAFGYDYSLVYRFTADFEQGDEAEVVLWRSLPAAPNVTEYFRSAAVLNDRLYVGTFDGMIYSTDGTGLKTQTPTKGVTGAGIDGWDLEAAFYSPTGPFEDFAGGAIWDLIGYNDCLYAFVSDQITGYRVYKMDADGVWSQIVSEAGKYPIGMGNEKHVAASPFIITVDDVDYVYVTTFANGPLFLVSMVGDILGMVTDPSSFSGWSSFEDYWAPAVMYRFGADDEWELVVGDNTLFGENRIGNMRAGFYDGINLINPSSNQYIWWMAEFDGKIYASTWDMGVFREPLVEAMGLVFDTTYGTANRAALDAAVEDLQVSLQKVVQNVSETEYTAIVTNIQGLLETAAADAQGNFGDIPAIIQALLDDIRAEFDALVESVIELAADVQALYESVTTFIELVSDTSEELFTAGAATLGVMFMTPVFGFFLMDTSNPPGFDLYVSEDGVNFSPVTLDGFGDPNNYGGRVLIPSEYGLFVLTANPFTGGQVWLLGAEPEDTGGDGPGGDETGGETGTGGDDEGLDTVLIVAVAAVAIAAIGGVAFLFLRKP